MSQGVFEAPHAFASGTLAELRLAQGRVEDAARVLRGVEGRTEAAAAVASSSSSALIIEVKGTALCDIGVAQGRPGRMLWVRRNTLPGS